MLRRKVEIEIDRPVGAKAPFWSGGSFRIVLPGWMARKYGNVKRNQPINEDVGLDELPFLFYPTTKGILMIPLDQAAKDKDLCDMLGFRSPRDALKKLRDNIEELDRKLAVE